MRKIKLIMLSLLFLSLSGCGVVEGLLSDVDGYDLSACAAAPTVCIELALDNIDKVEQ